MIHELPLEVLNHWQTAAEKRLNVVEGHTEPVMSWGRQFIWMIVKFACASKFIDHRPLALLEVFFKWYSVVHAIMFDVFLPASQWVYGFEKGCQTRMIPETIRCFV